jgi:transaldolase
LSVKQIYHYYKQHQIKTEVMGASFRSIDQVLGLAGCDLLTVAPGLLEKLKNDQRHVVSQLSLDTDQTAQEHQEISKAEFKQQLEADLMAFQLLQSGIDGFIKAREQLALLLRQSFGLDADFID